MSALGERLEGAVPYDEDLAVRIRGALGAEPGISERKMFGGLCFMQWGNMVCGIADQKLMLRVGPGAHDETLALPHAAPMDFTGRPMKGMVYVNPEGYASDAELGGWLRRALAFSGTLPRKS